jgi:hypothetical protein
MVIKEIELFMIRGGLCIIYLVDKIDINIVDDVVVINELNVE